MKNLTTNTALLFSWSVLIIYVILCEIQLFLGVALDSELTIAIFATFGVAEGGYCAFIHKLKKEAENKAENEVDDGNI